MTEFCYGSALMIGVPKPYDAICEWCEAAYLYKYARSLGVEKWKEYCSPSCEEHNPGIVTDRKRRANQRTTERLLAEQANKAA
jgi:hypothetical protein